MTKPVRVRPATPADAATLAELNDFVHALHVENRPDFFRTPSSADELVPIFRAFLEREDTFGFVAESAGRAVGYVTATVRRHPGDALVHPRNVIFVDHIAVDPALARAGVGTALVESVRAAGREVGCTRMMTDVWAFNERALAFFESAGLARMTYWLEQPLE
ncbi:GNAT family N-acetyltransferase [Nonomuraea rhodomycinica]|uniref:GNAT family N-acetyltransferase n=1 Tax=Nonomuraea rhodomycinica TaxID=1712872 RepID=A0A7Y6IVY8_9ACTN|nr:GNAT family N-acetyltransferase [Nonomuraea rhodomycinica]NUW45402.1 GNAT family N-acetyltransferase [Nonomuraea rhodomycinica]